MLEGLRSAILNKIAEIISIIVKKEVASALASLEANVTTHGQAMEALESAANDWSNLQTSLEAKVSLLTGRVDSLSKKCEDLEGCSRLNNVRVIGVPERSEGAHPTDFMAMLLQKQLGLEKKPTLDRAHRTLWPRLSDGESPRLFVVRTNMFQQRNEILRRTSSSASLLHEGKKILIFPDFTAAVVKKCASFIKVKKEQHSC